MNLCKLELMKIKVSTYLWSVVGIFAGLLALGILFLFIFRIEMGGNGISEEAALFGNWNGLSALMTALSYAGFSIFSAVIAAKVVVGEYCGRNAVILLCYPISRKAMLRAKCLVICGITTIAALVSNVLVIGLMYVAAEILNIEPQMAAEHFFGMVVFSSVFMGFLSSALGVISAVVGWKKRSATAVIVCALLIVCITTNFIAISPGNVLGVMSAMCAFFVVIAYGMYHSLVNGIEQMEV